MITQYVLAFGLYFSILLFIGWLSHHRQTSNSEFIVGNRTLSFWLIALSAHASDMSAWLFIGLPMAIFVQGMSGSWIAIGLFAGMFATWIFVARRLREATEKLGTFTLSTYFEKRFADTTGTLRLLTAAMLLFFLTHYLAAGLTAMGLLIESLFGINYYWGLTVATLVVVIYTFSGGFVTIAWTDLFQGMFLLIAIMIVPLLTLFQLDGIAAVESHATANPAYLSLFGDMSSMSLLSALILFMSWGLGYFGMPHIITKFLGIRNASEMWKSMCVGMTWQFLALAAAIGVGITGATYFDGQLMNAELVFVELVKVLFHPFFAGFVLCGVLAANLSTMDSQLLVCASVLGEDLYKRFVGKHVRPEYLVRATRCGLLLIAVTALLLAFGKNQALIDSVLYAWAGLGSSFGPLVLMSLYSKVANRNGAVAGIISGGFISATWPTLNSMITSIAIPSMIPGFFTNLLCVYIVSLATQKKQEATI